MSNNIGIAIPNNYSRAPMRRMPVPTRSRVSSIPQISNYALSNNVPYPVSQNSSQNLDINPNSNVNPNPNTNSNLNPNANLNLNQRNTELRNDLQNQIATLSRNLNQLQSRLDVSANEAQTVRTNLGSGVQETPSNHPQIQNPEPITSQEIDNNASQTQPRDLSNNQENTTTRHPVVELETLQGRIDKLEQFYGKEIDDLTRTVAVLKEQFESLENGYRSISKALTNIVEELEQSPDEDVILTRVDDKIDIKDADSSEGSVDQSEAIQEQ